MTRAAHRPKVLEEDTVRLSTVLLKSQYEWLLEASEASNVTRATIVRDALKLYQESLKAA